MYKFWVGGHTDMNLYLENPPLIPVYFSMPTPELGCFNHRNILHLSRENPFRYTRTSFFHR